MVSVGVMQPLIDPFFEGYHTLKTFPDDPNIEVTHQHKTHTHKHIFSSQYKWL
jgi:hypothetical protein